MVSQDDFKLNSVSQEHKKSREKIENGSARINMTVNAPRGKIFLLISEQKAALKNWEKEAVDRQRDLGLSVPKNLN